MKVISRKRIRWVGRVVVASIAVAGVVAVGQPAHAYTLQTSGSCSEVRWSTAKPVYKIHIYEFFDGGGTVDDLVSLFSAVYDVMREFNNIGGTTATVDLSGNTSDARPYDANTPFNDPTPTIHIGFTNDPYDIDSSGTAHASTKFSVDQKTCTYTEARITFRDYSLQKWDLGTPSSASDKYWTTTDTDPSSYQWFRPIMLHELLHAFGLAHSDNTYSFMNYLDTPWVGGGVAETDAIRPLPDDARAIRYLYPGTSTREEIALLTTWYDTSLEIGGSADQLHLCTPSLGDALSSNPFDYWCGTGGSKAGSTKVCAGDKLYTRFTFANYSTDKADNVNVRLYLSSDDVWDFSDPISPTGINVTVDSGRSKWVGKGWDVPSGLVSGTKYYVIMDAVGATSSGAQVESWTPLPGLVTAC
jgi:hypothetical protein